LEKTPVIFMLGDVPDSKKHIEQLEEKRVVMPRYDRGDRVRISPALSSPFAGAEGVIDEVTPHPKKLAQLDSYVVLFGWGERQKFWDAELETGAGHRPPSKSTGRL
jgi:hypothetical protein